MNKTPTISIDPDEIERLRELLPEDEGAFSCGDVIKALGLPRKRIDWLMKVWREEGIIEPAGKVNRANAWGDAMRVPGYRFGKSEEEGGDTE